MFWNFKKELQAWTASRDPDWNWRNLRSIENPIHPATNVLPDITRNFMRAAGEVTQSTLIIHGGALNDLASGRQPKDMDGYALTELQPLVALGRMEMWARKSGYEVVQYDRRIRWLWKRLIVKMGHGAYDLSFLHGDMPLKKLAEKLADDLDVSPCAQSATSEHAFQSQRYLDGETSNQLIFRPLNEARARLRHLDRWHKYAIVKYPERAVVYQNAREAELFRELDLHRGQIRELHQRLLETGNAPKNFEPFRPFVPRLYEQLHLCAHA